MIVYSHQRYGREAVNRIDKARTPGIVGARSLLEAFYYAFNQRDLAAFAQVWAEHDLIQLNNPLGGILRGYEPIGALYDRIFTGDAAAANSMPLSLSLNFNGEHHAGHHHT